MAASMSASMRVGTTVRLPASTSSAAFPKLGRRVIARAGADDEAELEKRLEKLRQVKGATPYGQGKTRAKAEGDAPAKPSAPAAKPQYDFSNEQLHWEGAPATADLIFNLAMGTTLAWLPLTIASIGRIAFTKFRFTNKRFSVTTTAPWKTESTEVAYQEVKEVVVVSRLGGLFGDMVVTLNNGDKIELRSLEKYKDLKQYILERRDALGPPPSAPRTTSKPKGKELTAAELLGETEPAEAKPKKGFA